MERIESKLRNFKKKYFFNEWLKGFLLTLLLGVFLLISVVVLEGIGKFDSSVRTVLFYTFLIGASFLFLRYTAWTFYKWVRYKKFLSDKQSAKAIRSKLKGVDDYLISYLELSQMESNEWVSEGKKQMENKLQHIEFGNAISWKENKRRGLLLLIPLVIVGFAILTEWGQQWVDSSERIVRYSEEFIPVAPFQFSNDTEDKVIANQELTIVLSLSNGYRPDEVFLVIDGVKVGLVQSARKLWTKDLRAPNHDFSYSFEVDGYKSPTYTTRVIQLPVLTQYSMVVTPPSYTRQPTTYLSNAGNFSFLEGSRVEWNVKTKNTSNSLLIVDGETSESLEKGSFSNSFFRSFTYSIQLENADSTVRMPFDFSANVVVDQSPSITDFSDSLNPSTQLLEAYVSGSDDYQVKKIVWYTIDESGEYSTLFTQSINSQVGDHYLYIDTIGSLMQKGAVSIVARIYDNNGVRGSQFTESRKIALVTLSREEKNELEKERISNNSKQLSDRSEKLEKLRKESKELQAKEGKKWSDVQKQKKLLEEYEEELAKLEEQQKELAEQLQKQEDTPLTEEEKKLQEILEKLNDPELQEFLKSLQEKADENNLTPEDLEQLGQEMDYQMNQLERLEELYKDVVFQMELDQQIDRIEEAIKKAEESLEKGEKADDSKESKAAEEKAQEEAEKLAEEVAKAQEELEKKNKDLKQPYKGMEDAQEKADSAEKKSKKASEEMKYGNPSKSQQQKQQSKEDLEALQSLLSQMQSSMSQEKKKENIEHMEQLLDNVVWTSFTEEDLYDDFRELSVNNPAFKEKLIAQGDLAEKLQHIQDSLDALMERVPELDPVLDKKVRALKTQQQKSVKALQDANLQEGGRYQRDIMYNLNYIAWVLSDLLQQMRQDLSSQMQGNQNCQKPGGSSSSPSAAQMLKMQQQLGKEFGESGPPDQKGQKPSQKKGKGLPMGGQEGQGGEGGMSGQQAKELAQMLARQEQIRMELEKKVEQGGPGVDAVDAMKEFEKELVDPNISFEKKKERLQEIETRLLEVEEAERTQEKEEQRESDNLELYMELRQKAKEDYLQRKKSYREDLTVSPIWLQDYYSRIKRSYND
ncbi:MAG: hypothetical protein SchgKO_01810 [Schleiferiaceae bacterium]